MAIRSNFPDYDGFEKLRLLHENKSDTPTFHPFSKLPAELRLEIWALAMSERQIASLTEGDSSGIDDDIKHGRLPAFLFVNYECRSRALETNRYPIRFTFRHAQSPEPSPSSSNNKVVSDPVEHLPSEHPLGGVQHCAIGPNDIVALRFEKAWYRCWQRCREYFYDDPHIGHLGPPVRFDGFWGGNYESIRNWMMPTPLIPRHPDPDSDGIIGGGKIPYWSKYYFELNFYSLVAPYSPNPDESKNIPHPHVFYDECLYYLVYDWHKPKKENLTAYDLEPLEACSK